MNERAKWGHDLRAMEKDKDVSLWNACERARNEVQSLRAEICRLQLAVEAERKSGKAPIENAAARLEDTVTLLIRAKAVLDALEAGLDAINAAENPIDGPGSMG